MRALIDRVLQMEEINGDGMCPTYLYRWTLLSTPWFKVYLHHFVGDDWSLDLHDHPKRFVSIGLRGSYLEERYEPKSGGRVIELFEAPWIRTFPATHRHRLRLTLLEDEEPRGCWTLVIVGPWQRDWGFWDRGRWRRWDDYVGSDRAYARRSCP